MKINNQQLKPDDKINLIKNRIYLLNDSINLLNEQKIILIKKIKKCYDMNERYIYQNNLALVISMILFYKNKRYNLKELLSEYLNIISDEKMVTRKEFMEIWIKKVDKVLNEKEEFKFDALNIETLINYNNSIYIEEIDIISTYINPNLNNIIKLK